MAERWVDGGLWIVCPDTAGVHVRADRSLAGVRLVHDRRPRVGRGRPTEDPWSRRCHGFVAAWAARLLELDAAVQFGWLATLMHDTGHPQRTADHPVNYTIWVVLHFLLYAVYICQKSLNFTYAFKCYQQNCKLASL